ncbi:MAG: DMT family transporter [Bdellovibrio sp.]
MKSWKGPLQVLISGSCFGLLGIFAKWAYHFGFSVGELLTLRFLFASLVLGVSLLLFRPAWLLLPGKQILISLLLGLLGYAVFSTLYFESIKEMTVGLAALLLFTFPLLVNIGSVIFLNERLTKLRLASSSSRSCARLHPSLCFLWAFKKCPVPEPRRAHDSLGFSPIQASRNSGKRDSCLSSFIRSRPLSTTVLLISFRNKEHETSWVRSPTL